MLAVGHTIFIPFGCSCINQFQLNMEFDVSGKIRGLLDITLSSPEATISVMLHIINGTLLDALGDRSAYHTEGPAGHLETRAIPGLFFWHEDGAKVLDEERRQNFDDFVAKVRGRAITMVKPPGSVNLLWSNIQPNLELAMLPQTHLTMMDFFLSREIFERFTELAQIIYPNSKVHFISREEEACPTLEIEPNVNFFVLPRSDDPKGPIGFYKPLFSRILSK